MSRINNGIMRHLEELTLENERLKEENKKLRADNRKLRAENERLRKRVEELEATMDDKIAKAVDEAVVKATAPLLETIAAKEDEILRLKGQIGRDSSNSSKPPGSNGYKKVLNNREKSSKKQGGQHGHRGARLNIPENLAELVEAGIAEHEVVSEVEEGEAYVSDWTVDIDVTVTYTERRRKPGAPPRIGYGPKVKSLAVYLSVVGLIAYKRLSDFFREVSHGLILASKDTLAGFNRRAADAVNQEAYEQDLLNGETINVDDTQIKTSERPGKDGVLETKKKTTFSVYIRTHSNPTTTVLTAHPSKSEETIKTDNILPRFHGILAHDHEAKFYNYGTAYATCCAHLTRELKGMSELQMLPWADGARSFFLEMNEHKLEDIGEGRTSCDAALLALFEGRYDSFVISGKEQLGSMRPKSLGFDELRCMTKRLEKHKDNYMLFMRNYAAPFHEQLGRKRLEAL